jgi:hypothetical protein
LRLHFLARRVRPLTTNTDKETAEKFESGLDYTPGGNDRVNTLQDEDELTGKGDSASLDVTLGNSNDNGATTVTPTLTNIKTVDVAFSGSGGTAVDQLDLQDTSGIETLNITRINDGINTELTLDNVKATTTSLSVSNSEEPDQSIDFAYDRGELSAGDDAATVTLDEVEVTNLEIDERGTAEEGFETISMTVDGLSLLGQVEAEDLQTLNIDGAEDLTIGGTVAVNEAGTTNQEVTGFTAGLAAVDGSLTTVDASEMTGDLTYHVGDEIDANQEGTTSGVVNMTITGGSGADQFVLTNGANVGGAADNTDVIDGGAGADTLTINGTATVAAADTANLRSIENVEVRSGHDDDNGDDNISLDFDAFDADVADVFVRNEGHDADNVSEAENMVVNLTDMSETEADNIRIGHSNSTNNGISNNDLNVNFGTDAADNSATVSIVDDLGNQDPVFNFQLDVADGEQVTLADKDSESNSIDLTTANADQADSSLTVTDGTEDQYLNLDVDPDGADDDADGDADDFTGYGTATDGTTGDATSAAAADDRDTDVARVFEGAANGDDVTRHDFETVAAGDFVGNLEMRLDEITQADGVTSMEITTGSGDDTLIFDAQDVDNAGFTSADTVAMGAGTDTMVIDGDTTDEPGTPRIDHQASEWNNLSGVDVLRYGSNDGVANGGGEVAYNAGSYFGRIDDEFIGQTDDGNRLTVVNNDGLITEENESDLVLDMRGLDQDNHVTFVGADGDGNGNISSNRLVVDDVSMDEGMRLDGGDTNTTADAVGNNNVLEIRDTANVSVDDLSNVSNFDSIELTSLETSVETLTLTLNNTIVEQMVDSNNTSQSDSEERLSVSVADVAGGNQATNGALVVNAGSVTGDRALDVTGEANNEDDDVVSVNANVGGSAHDIDLNGGTGDRVNFEGGNADSTIDADLDQGADGSFDVTTNGNTVNHVIQDVEILDISDMTYNTSDIAGDDGDTDETIIGGAGDDTITGDQGDDTLTGGAGADVFTYTAADEGGDTITDFSGDAGEDDTIDGLETLGGDLGGVITFEAAAVDGADVTADADDLLVVSDDSGTGRTADSLSTADVATYLADVDGAGSSILDADTDTSDFLVAVSDGTDTGIFLLNDADGGDGGVIAQGELSLQITLQGIDDASVLVTGDFV